MNIKKNWYYLFKQLLKYKIDTRWYDKIMLRIKTNTYYLSIMARNTNYSGYVSYEYLGEMNHLIDAYGVNRIVNMIINKTLYINNTNDFVILKDSSLIP